MDFAPCLRAAIRAMGPTSPEVRRGNERSYLPKINLTLDPFLVRPYSLIAR